MNIIRKQHAEIIQIKEFIMEKISIKNAKKSSDFMISLSPETLPSYETIKFHFKIKEFKKSYHKIHVQISIFQ